MGDGGGGGGGGGGLLVPFLVSSFLGNIIQSVKLFMSGDYNWMHYVLTPCKSIIINGSCGGNLPLWFLPSLMAVQLLYHVMKNKMNDQGIFALSLLVAYSSYKFNLYTPLYLGNIFLGLASYCFGHMMKDSQYHHVYFILSIMLFTLILIVHPSTIDFRLNEIQNGYYLIAVLFSLSGCIIVNNIFKRVSCRLKILEWIGKHSMDFYVLHWIILLACNITFSFVGWKMFATMLFLSGFLLPTMILLLRYLHLQRMFGE